MTSLETNIMEITIWELLTISSAIEVENFDETGFSFQNYLTQKLQNTINTINNLLSNGENYPCSYVFFFRSILLNENLHFEVYVTIFLYYVYQTFHIFLLEYPIEGVCYTAK